jgi:hypothetical protein
MSVRRLNDASLEHLIAVLRYSSIASGLAAVLALCVFALAGRASWAYVGAILAGYTAAAGWLGWWHFGNASWRGGNHAVPSDVPRPGREAG